MDNNARKAQLLQELKKLTGISFDISSDSEENDEKIISTLSALCESYKKNGTREALLRRYIDGECSENELLAAVQKLHIHPEKKRILYLIELESQELSPAVQLVKQLLTNRSDAYIIPHGKCQIIIIESADKAKASDFSLLAENMVSMLNTELYISSKVSYSLVVSGILDVKNAWDQAVYAMNTGNRFSPELMVYSYNRLESGRIMNDVSSDTALAYIQEITGRPMSEETKRCFQNEFQTTANCFLKNDLNIAVTARQLHVHRNTLLYRLEIIQNETSLDIRHFDDAMKYRLVSLCLALLKN